MEIEGSKTKRSNRPCLVLTGGQGVGKSFEAASAFHDWLFFQTSLDTHEAIHDYTRKCPAEAAARGVKVPKDFRVLVDDRDQRGDPKTNWFKWYKEKLYTISMARRAGKFPWPGIVWDEYNTLLDWIQRSIERPANKAGAGIVGYDGQDELINLLEWTHQVRAETGIGMVFVMHWDEPRIWDKGPKVGTLQYPGRPQTPFGRYSPILTKDASAVWQLTLEPGGTRRYHCAPEFDGTQLLRLRKTRKWNSITGKDDEATALLDSDGTWVATPEFGLREALEGLGWQVSGGPTKP